MEGPLGISYHFPKTFSTLSLTISLGFNYFQGSFNVRLSMGPNCLLCIDQLYQLMLLKLQFLILLLTGSSLFIVPGILTEFLPEHCALTSAMTHMWVVLPRFILSLYIAVAAGGVAKW